mmetsp:Transcript_11998/g.39414  ORF Transcript_11998/g.39414 Transcript_11998/m.39414 type:complete len:234 (+) Transcript_11998:791-1492(+)
MCPVPPTARRRGHRRKVSDIRWGGVGWAAGEGVPMVVGRGHRFRHYPSSLAHDERVQHEQQEKSGRVREEDEGPADPEECARPHLGVGHRRGPICKQVHHQVALPRRLAAAGVCPSIRHPLARHPLSQRPRRDADVQPPPVERANLVAGASEKESKRAALCYSGEVVAVALEARMGCFRDLETHVVLLERYTRARLPPLAHINVEVLPTVPRRLAASRVQLLQAQLHRLHHHP